MTKLSVLVAALTGLGASACSTSDGGAADRAMARADARLAQFEQTGEIVSCLSLRSIDSIDPLDEQRWLVTERNRTVWLATASRGCNGAGAIGTYLQYRTTMSQLCRGEIISVVDRGAGFTRGSCSIQEFERLEPGESGDG